MGSEGTVDSEVLQGTALGPCLFNIFIDDIDDCVVGTIELVKFANDRKGMKVIEGVKDHEDLQEKN